MNPSICVSSRLVSIRYPDHRIRQLRIADQIDECQGADGVSTESDVPSIAGISPFIIEEYMLEYREEARICRESKYRSGDLERPVTDMCVVAKDLSEDDIAEIAEFYGSKEIF